MWLPQAGVSGIITWSRGKHQTASIGYVVSESNILLHYQYTPHDGETKKIREHVKFDLSDQNFGGQRRWFLCPSCHSRCRILYGGLHFRCRKCQKLTYESQYEPFPVGCMNRALEARVRLGGERSMLNPYPDKPKGMHWRTYQRLLDADWRAQEHFDKILSRNYRCGNKA